MQLCRDQPLLHSEPISGRLSQHLRHGVQAVGAQAAVQVPQYTCRKRATRYGRCPPRNKKVSGKPAETSVALYPSVQTGFALSELPRSRRPRPRRIGVLPRPPSTLYHIGRWPLACQGPLGIGMTGTSAGAPHARDTSPTSDCDCECPLLCVPPLSSIEKTKEVSHYTRATSVLC